MTGQNPNSQLLAIHVHACIYYCPCHKYVQSCLQVSRQPRWDKPRDCPPRLLEGTKSPSYICMAISNENLGNGWLYTLGSTQTAWLEGPGNRGGRHQYLIVGNHPQYPKKRSLVQFEDLPSQCKSIKWAKMYLYFHYAHKASWQSVDVVPYIERGLAVHQVKKPWREEEVTSSHRDSGTLWSQPYLALDDTDAATYSQDAVTIFTGRPAGYVEFDITEAMRNWKDGQPNYGLLVWATNEDVEGRDLRFYSRDNTENKPLIRVLCNWTLH